MRTLSLTAVASFYNELEKISGVVPIEDPGRHGSKELPSGALAAFRKRYALAGAGAGDGCSLGLDKDGYYAYTHRARSKSYPTPELIPLARVRFVASTA